METRREERHFVQWETLPSTLIGLDYKKEGMSDSVECCFRLFPWAVSLGNEGLQ